MKITSKGQVTIPQSPSRGEEALQRLRQARLTTPLSTDELLALTRGEDLLQERAHQEKAG